MWLSRLHWLAGFSCYGGESESSYFSLACWGLANSVRGVWEVGVIGIGIEVANCFGYHGTWN